MRGSGRAHGNAPVPAPGGLLAPQALLVMLTLPPAEPFGGTWVKQPQFGSGTGSVCAAIAVAQSGVVGGLLVLEWCECSKSKTTVKKPVCQYRRTGISVWFAAQGWFYVFRLAAGIVIMSPAHIIRGTLIKRGSSQS